MAIAMGWQKPDNVAGSSAPGIMVGLFVASGGLLFGYDTGAINGILAMREFKDQFGTNCSDAKGNPDFCTNDSAIIVGILSIGTLFGALLSAPAADRIGRRHTFLISVIVFCIGSICQVCATAVSHILAGRFLSGVGVGAISVLVPLYQSEMAPTWIRGTLVCAYQFSITVGLLSASVINIITANIEGSAAYRIPLGLQFVPALILTGGIIILPETPRFLVMKGLPDQAGLSLSRLRRLDITHPALVDELQEIIANHQYELTLGPSSYRDLFRGSPHLARRTFTGCAVQILQQLTGINFILYYSTTFFGAVGVESPYTKSLIVNAINVVSTIPGLIIIESWGRRKLLMVGASGMAICQLVMATFAAAAGTDMQETAQLILIIFCNINVFFFAASWGPVAWVVTSEIYPLKVRAKAMSLSTMSNWLLNFSIAYASPFMVGKGPGHGDFGSKIFFIWGAFCLIAVFCVWGLVYETSRLSLEQIDEMYERVPRAWDSKNFEPSWSFQQILNEGWAASANPPPPGSHGSNGGPPPSPGAEAQELQSTMSISQASADTTLGDSASSETAHNNDGSQGGNPRPPSNEENKNQPVMAHVDFTY